MFQIFDVLESSRLNQERQERVTSRLENISFQAIRQYYPLEPVTLVFVIEYPMDQPYLADFAGKIMKEIHQYLVGQREGRGETDPELKNEDVIFRLSSREDWLPSAREARFNLLEDSTIFAFKRVAGNTELRFLSTRKGNEKLYVSLPLKGTPEQEITLFADFKKRVFIKEVTSRNPLRTGKDLFAISALDIVGRTMQWSSGSSIMPEDANAKWHLTKFGFVFPYDYDKRSTSRKINSTRAWKVPGGVQSHLITADNVGLADVYDDLGIEEYFAK